MSAFAKLKKLISEELGIEVEKITPATHLDKDLNLGQKEISDFILALEERLALELKPEEVKNIETIGDLTNLVRDHLGEVE